MPFNIEIEEFNEKKRGFIRVTFYPKNVASHREQEKKDSPYILKGNIFK